MIYNDGELSAFNGGGFNSRFTLHLDAGPTYDGVHLQTNLNNDQITRVVLELNGDPIVDVDAKYLRTLEAYKGRPTPNGRFYIPLVDHTMNTEDGQMSTGLVTLSNRGDGSADNLVLQVYTGAATAAQVAANTVPELKGYFVSSPARATRSIIPRLTTEVLPAGSTGWVNYRNFNRGPRIRRMHIMTNNVDELEIWRDKIKRFGLDKSTNNYLLQREKRVPQANVFHFDPVRYGWGIRDSLQTQANSFEVKTHHSSAGDFEVLFETVEFVGQR